MSQLRQDQTRARDESEAVVKERERLEKLAKEVEERSQEAEKLHQVKFLDYWIIMEVYSITKFIYYYSLR
jgi:hypothetical protein